MDLSEKVNTGEVTVVHLASIRHAEETGQRPEGYVQEYCDAALRVDEEHELIWITREEQNRLIRQYRTGGAPDTIQAKRDARKIREGFMQEGVSSAQSKPVRSDRPFDVTLDDMPDKDIPKRSSLCKHANLQEYTSGSCGCKKHKNHCDLYDVVLSPNEWKQRCCSLSSCDSYTKERIN